MGRDLIHIGLPKTATTWLQQGFRAASEAGKIVIPGGEIGDWIRKFRRADPQDVDFTDLTAALQNTEGSSRVLSREMLIQFDFGPLANALHDAWPDARILVTTRNPQDFMRSYYTRLVRAGRPTKPINFGRRFARQMMLHTHDFNRLHHEFAARFGEGNIHFYPYEDIRESPARYLAFIDDLVGVPVSQLVPSEPRNVSPPPDILELARRISAALSAHARQFYDRREWHAFLYIALSAIGNSSEMWPRFRELLEEQDIRLDPHIPRLDDDLRSTFAEMATVLKRYARYDAYREAYFID